MLSTSSYSSFLTQFTGCVPCTMPRRRRRLVPSSDLGPTIGPSGVPTLPPWDPPSLGLGVGDGLCSAHGVPSRFTGAWRGVGVGLGVGVNVWSGSRRYGTKGLRRSEAAQLQLQFHWLIQLSRYGCQGKIARAREITGTGGCEYETGSWDHGIMILGSCEQSCRRAEGQCARACAVIYLRSTRGWQMTCSQGIRSNGYCTHTVLVLYKLRPVGPCRCAVLVHRHTAHHIHGPAPLAPPLWALRARWPHNGVCCAPRLSPAQQAYNVPWTPPPHSAMVSACHRCILHVVLFRCALAP